MSETETNSERSASSQQQQQERRPLKQECVKMLEELGVGTGSISDFIDSTILRCLNDYDRERAAQQLPSTDDPKKASLKNELVGLTSGSREADWILAVQNRAGKHPSKVLKRQALRQTRRKLAVDRDGLSVCQKEKSQRSKRSGAKEVSSDTDTRENTHLISPQTVTSESLIGSSGNQLQDPSASGLDDDLRKFRHLLRTSLEESSQGESKSLGDVWKGSWTSFRVIKNSDSSSFFRPDVSEGTSSARPSVAFASTRNGFAGQSAKTSAKTKSMKSVDNGVSLSSLGADSGLDSSSEEDVDSSSNGADQDETGRLVRCSRSAKLRVPSPYKATDKVKKRLQKRYFEAEPETESSTPEVETFTIDGNKRVSEWRIQKWKKRRLKSAEDGDAADPKSKKNRSSSKGPPGKQKPQPKTGEKKKTERSLLDDLEQPGLIEYSSDEDPDRLTQTEITEAVDITSATKYFQLNLPDFGPYNIHYTLDGRHLLLGGELGHVAAFEWQTKRLSFELNIEPTSCVRWLHRETMLAAAHPSGICFYDNNGLETHALTDLDAVLRMEFLPHHMLLASANAKGFLGYTDVSMGTRVASICTGLGRLDVMTQNTTNAVIYLGHAPGTVTLWTPNVKGPLMKILTHKAPVRALAIDSTGNYLATSGVDKRLKVFDLRTYKSLSTTRLPMGACSLNFSQRGLLAAAMGNRVQVYKDCRRSGAVTHYLSHVVNSSLSSLQFCPFEDVLGVGHQRGFSSLIVPGSGEANYDALSVNPLANRKQRQNTEVRQVLDKLKPEMVGLKNWVWEVASKPGEKKAPQPSATKMGKKQKEEQQREKAREKLKEKKKQRKKTPSHTDPDPLSRFK